MKNLIWYFCFIAVLYIGCSNDSVPDNTGGGGGGHVTGIECVITPRHDSVEYDYMWKSNGFGNDPDSFYSFTSVNLTSVQNAFSTRGQVNLEIDKGYSGSVTGLKTAWKIIYQDAIGLGLSMDSFYRAMKTTNSKFFICSIDTFSVEDVSDVNTFGKTRKRTSASDTLQYSFVFDGKMNNRRAEWYSLDGFRNFHAYAWAHEIGHQIGLILDNESDTGQNSNQCMMQYSNNPFYGGYDPIRDGFTYCDKHVCAIYSGSQLGGNAASPFARNSGSSKLDYSISTNKKTYLEGEPIFLTLTIKNNSFQMDSVIWYNSKGFVNTLKLRNSQFVAPFSNLESSSFFVVPYIKVNPGGEVSFQTELQEHYGYVDLGNVFYNVPFYFNSNNYTVQYYTSDGKVSTNELKFNVVKPTETDSIIFNQLLNIYHIQEWDNSTPQEKWQRDMVEKKFIMVKNLIDSYLENSYTPILYSLYNRISFSLGVKEDIIDRNLWFLNKYPDSYYLKEIVYNTAAALFYLRNGSQSVNDVFTKLITDHSNSKLAFEINDLLNSKRYKEEFK